MPRRFLLPIPIAPTGSVVCLDKEESRHLARVLRHRPGDTVQVFDGQGGWGRAVVEEAAADAARLRIVEQRQASPPLARLHLAQALLKGDKMDLVIQKSVELGVAAILPCHSRHCAANRPSVQRMRRWRRIAREAAKQCGRLWLPHVAEPEELHAVVNRFDHVVFFWENGEAGEAPSLPAKGDCLLVVGPEGGFSSEEAADLCAQGAIPASLGPFILRAETAAIAAVAVSMFRLRQSVTSCFLHKNPAQ